jgi:hypothetical protein
MQNRVFKIILAIFILSNVLTVPTANAEAQSYFVGDKGPSGGTIAYVDEYDKFSWDYIEAAPANWIGEKSTESIRWSPFGASAASLTGLGSAIGDGAANTTKILNTFGTGWGIKSAVRDINDCKASDGIKYCNVTITLDTNHGVTRFDVSQSPIMPIFCDGVFLDSFYASLTGEMKVVDARSFSFVENGYQLKLADQINSKGNCKISFAAEVARSAKIGGYADWVLPSYDELAQVQRAVGTNNQSPYAIDQSILTKNGYTAGYYSTSTLRDASNQRVWGFTNATVAGKGGSVSLLYGAAVLPIRYFKTSVAVRNKEIVGEENATPGPTEISAQILQTDTNWYAKGSPFKVRGSIQIPANVTLKIHAGAVVDFTEANVTLLGKIVIGSNSSPLVTKVSLGSDFISKGNGGQVTIENSEIIGKGGVINQWDGNLSSLTIDNSTISKFRYLAERTVSKLFISNSVIRDMEAITSEFSYIYDFSLTNNVLYELKSFATPGKGVFVNVGQAGPRSIFTGNLILNSANRLNFKIPNSADPNVTIVFENNRFESPKLLDLSGGTKAGGNYWNATDEANLRILAKVSDGKSDITLPIISFAPFLTSAPAAPSKYQALSDLLIVEKKAAIEKETSDKLLSNVVCSLTDSGVRYESSFANSATASTLKDVSFSWQYALLKAGASPGTRTNYGTFQVFRTTPTLKLEITYEDLLKLAGGIAAETILVVSAPTVTIDSSVITNNSGKGCIAALSEVLANKQAAEKIVADKVVAEKAAAEKKIAAEKAAADKVATDKAAADLKAKQEADAKAAADLKAKQDAEAKAKAAAAKKTTITCVKGKLTKKVTAVKPVCPKGYKKK